MNRHRCELEAGASQTRRTAWAGRMVALVGAACGGTVAWGWMVDDAPARRLFLESAPVSLLAACCLMLIGAALWLALGGAVARVGRRVSRGCAVLAVGLAAVVVVDGLAGGTLMDGAMQWMVGQGGIRAPAPGPGLAGGAFLGGICFLLFGLALMLRPAEGVEGVEGVGAAGGAGLAPVAQLAAGLGTSLALIAVAVQVIGRGAYQHQIADMAGPISVSILGVAYGLSLLLSQPSRDWSRTWLGPGAGSRALRRVVPAIIILSVLAAWLGLRGEEVGWYSAEFAWVAFATVLPVGFTLILWGAARSINRLHRELEERSVAHARFTALVESSSDAIIAKDLQGVVTSWNPGAERLFGYTAEEMVGQPIQRLIPEDRHAEELVILSRLRRRERIEHFETIRRRKDGRMILVSISVSPIVDARGQVVGASKVARDISARRLAEDRAAWLATFPERNPIPIVELDPKTGRIHYANPSAREWFPTLEVEGIEHPLLANAAAVADQLSRDGGEVFHRELTVAGRVLAQTLTCVREARRLRIYNTDVTELRRALEAVHEKALRMRLATETTGVGIWEWNLADDRVRWDVQMFRIYGVSPTTDHFVPYKTWRDAVAPEEVAEQEALLQNTVRRRGSSSREFRIRRVDTGEWRIIQAMEVVLLASDGKPAWVVGTNLDITERRAAEEQVKASRAQFKLVVEAAPTAILLVDIEGRIMLANAHAETLFGYTRAELLGSPLEKLVPPRFRGIHPRHRAEYMAAPISRPMGGGRDLFARRKDGSEVPVEIGLSPIPTEEGMTVLASVIDITARKKAEEQRENLLRELGEKNAQMERFLYMVSHDLKSPLITIKAFASIVAQDLESGRPEQVNPDLGRITRAADKMNCLLEELLRFSRAGHAVNPLEEVSVSALAEEARELVDGRLTSRGVKVSIQPEMPVARVDRLRMVEVFQNLLDNAAKFMGEQPEPRVEVGMDGMERMESVAGRGGEPRFYVRDNGIGLDPRHHQHLFGLFNKLDPKTDGSGVGLALVKRIVELHGGRIWVESEGPGKGSTFWLTLGNALDRTQTTDVELKAP